jgi:hypothetical protein
MIVKAGLHSPFGAAFAQGKGSFRA